MSIYDFTVKDTEQKDISMKDYQGKVLLIVNTATACGLTPQYEGLQSLYEKHQNSGFEILDFPCNQFFGQAPGTDEEIVSFCQTKFHTTFKTFSKIEVNGDNTAPLYAFLKKQNPTEQEDEESAGLLSKLKEIGHKIIGDDIKWNFTKFLIDQEGNVVARYAPTVKPAKIDADVAKLLK